MNILDYYKLLRVNQYIKNLFIFLPLFFGLKIADWLSFSQTAVAFIGFCLVASAVYIFNDLYDIEEDKLHPVKKNRPIAAGKISKIFAWYWLIGLLAGGLLISLLLGPGIFSLFLLYALLNIFYTLKLKHLPIIDVNIVAANYVIRLFVGSIAAGVILSMWIILMTFLLALFIALAKRRDDVLIYLESGAKTRKAIDGYNLDFLNSSMIIMAAVLIVSYVLYTVSPDVIQKTHTKYLYTTAIFVILGVLRYMQLAFVEKKSDSPTDILLKDRFLQIVLAIWLLAFIFILYR